MHQPRLTTWRTDPLLLAAMLIVATTASVLAVLKYRGYNSGMLDLGAMTQAIFSVLRGQPLVTTGYNGNFSRLAGHVELIYLAFVPFLAIWPSPEPLLIGQAVLVALGAIPAYRIALRKLDSVTAARCAALIYLFYPVAQTALLFDFHGDTLAMPLLMFALDAADRRAWRPFALWVGLALLCKLYIAAPVAGIGAYLLIWGGARRPGLITSAVAVAYGALLFLVVREAFAPPELDSAARVYVNIYFGELNTVGTTLVPRLLNALIVFGPALLLARRGWRWLLPALPLTAAVLISSGPGAVYHYGYHHYATVVPFIVMAVIDGAARARDLAEHAPIGKKIRRWQPDLIFTTLIVLLTCALLVDQPLNPRFWRAAPGDGRDASAYGLTARDTVTDRFLAAHTSPPSVPIAASMFLASHLANRDQLYVVRYPDDPGGQRLPTLLPRVNDVFADALFDWRLPSGAQLLGGTTYEAAEIATLLRDPAFGLVAAQDGLLLFQRDAPVAERLRSEVAVVPTANLPARADYFGPIKLVGAAITPLSGRRYSASFAWTVTSPLPAGPRLLPVSNLEGVAGARMPHLPTFVLLPTDVWREGQIIRETFEVTLPPELPPGRYSWQVAWYDPSHPEAYATDARSLLPGSAPVTVTEIEVP